MAGRLLVGTSGFAYNGWSPSFYPPDLPADERLPYYAARLPACELNNTFYRRPSEAAIGGWLARTPPDFRFAVKTQRGGSVRALLGDDPAASVAWLTEPIGAFGERLGTVLFRVPAELARTDEGLAQLGLVLGAWPAGLAVTFELQDPSWHVDETFALLAAHRAVLCATELDRDADPPTVRATGPFLYLRLRRSSYTARELDEWAARLVPFLEADLDVFAFFRHDETGLAPGRAIELTEKTAARVPR